MASALAIVPRQLINVGAVKAAVVGCLDDTATEVEKDFGRTTATWSHDVPFTTVVQGWTRIVLTQEAIYAMLNKGTKPHVIMPRNARALVFQVPYSAKSSPGVIASKGGGPGGQTVYTRGPVNHPGTEARAWDQTIAETWLALFPVRMQQAITGAVKA